MVHMIEIVRQGKVDFPHQVIVSFQIFYKKKILKIILKYNMVDQLQCFCLKKKEEKALTGKLINSKFIFKSKKYKNVIKIIAIFLLFS